ncbi:MAG TPA: NifU family protein [Bacilli bacterium]|nr:NifU family protein [Bacilli bacterium]
MEEKIKNALDLIRPYLNEEGGDIEFVKYEDGYVYIKLLGGCATCPYRNETIKNGILEALKKDIPEIKGIINIEL